MSDNTHGDNSEHHDDDSAQAAGFSVRIRQQDWPFEQLRAQLKTDPVQQALRQAASEANAILCLCQPEPLPLHTRCVRNVQYVARNPGTGLQHNVRCAFHDGENPERKKTIRRGMHLRGSLALPALGTGAVARAPASAHESGEGGRGTVTLVALLDLLWDSARLSYWHPNFAGVRTHDQVCWRVLQAARSVPIDGVSEALEATSQRFVDTAPYWRRKLLKRSSEQQQLQLVLDALRFEIEHRHGGRVVLYSAVQKQRYGLEAGVYARLQATQPRALQLFSEPVDDLGVYALLKVEPVQGERGVWLRVHDIALLPVDGRTWLPVCSADDVAEVRAAVAARRLFAVQGRYGSERVVIRDVGEIF